MEGLRVQVPDYEALGAYTRYLVHHHESSVASADPTLSKTEFGSGGIIKSEWSFLKPTYPLAWIYNLIILNQKRDQNLTPEDVARIATIASNRTSSPIRPSCSAYDFALDLSEEVTLFAYFHNPSGKPERRVAGGSISALPGQGGIKVYLGRLDSRQDYRRPDLENVFHGNLVRGLEAARMGYSAFLQSLYKATDTTFPELTINWLAPTVRHFSTASCQDDGFLDHLGIRLPYPSPQPVRVLIE